MKWNNVIPLDVVVLQLVIVQDAVWQLSAVAIGFTPLKTALSSKRLTKLTLRRPRGKEIRIHDAT
jgi:hypothetical protein